MDFEYWIELVNKVVNIITGPAVIFSVWFLVAQIRTQIKVCLLYTSPSPRDQRGERLTDYW